jgi:hypothetical protein
MKVYLVGNFDLMVYPHKERAMYEHVTSQGKDYNRLVSYFKACDMDGIMALKYEHEGLEHPDKKPSEMVNSLGITSDRKKNAELNAERINKQGLVRKQ